MSGDAPGPGALLAAWLTDPFAGWTALAALVAAAAAWSGGLVRGDVRAFREPRFWLAVAAATALATAIAVGLTAAGAHGDPAAALAVRLPAMLLALLFGPSPGALAAALAAAVDPAVAEDAGRAVVHVLEAALIGWIALAPDPRRRRGAAGLAVAGGWTVAHATAGLSAAALAMPVASPASLLADLVAPAVAVATFAAVCAVVPPRAWRRASELAGSTLRDEAREEPLVVPPLRRRETPHRARLDPPPRPGTLPRPLALHELPVGSYGHDVRGPGRSGPGDAPPPPSAPRR